jgi:peptide/nickel transport system ATP-binding protein
MSALHIDDLSVWHGDTALVRNVSLDIPQGSVFTLLGESGSGKSLLAQAIMGKLPRGLRCEGRVAIAGNVTDAAQQSRRHAAWGRQIALLPQEPWLALDPTMKVWRQVAETYELVSQPAADTQNDSQRQARSGARTLAMRALQSLGLQDAANKYPFMISGGMAQRLAFLATHAAGAPLMIIDEPTKGLDHGRRAEVLALLQAAQREGMSLLCITHDVWLARELGGQLAVMLDGCMIERGTAADVLAAPQRQYTRRLLAADPEQWPATATPVAPGAAPLVEIRNLSKSFDAPLFANIDARIARGEVVAISGPSGAGKTTFGNLVLGLMKPDTGSVTRAAGLAPTAFQKLYQDPVAAFAPRLTLRRSLQHLVRLHGLNWSELEHLLTRMRIALNLLERRPGEVSGGELQRIALARALLLKPALLFADEPTSRLDPVSQQDVMALMLEQCRSHQCAVLLVTHDTHLARKVASRSIALR